MDPSDLISGGGVLAFAAVVYYAIGKIEKKVDKVLEIARALEERTAAPVAIAPERERTAVIRRQRVRTSPRGVPIERVRPGRDTVED